METALITMDPAKAKEAFQNYRGLIKRRHLDEDEILMRGYKHLSKGKQILDLVATMQKAGLDHLNRPRLAIARADWENCWFIGNGGMASVHPTFQLGRYIDRRERRGFIAVANAFPEQTRNVSNIKAKVPPVPPQYRPKAALGNYHILWEPTWTTEPPHDPMLLKFLGQNIYAVLATWNLTPLERAILR